MRLALSLFADINRYWDRIVDEKGDHKYNYGQILAQFETAAALFNRKILGNEGQIVLKDHIVEVWLSLSSSEHGKELIEQCRSASATFTELESFFKIHQPTALLADKFAQERTQP